MCEVVNDKQIVGEWFSEHTRHFQHQWFQTTCSSLSYIN